MSDYFEKFKLKEISTDLMKHVSGGNCVPFNCTCGIPSNVTFHFCSGAADIPRRLRSHCGTTHNTVGAGCVNGHPWEVEGLQTGF